MFKIIIFSVVAIVIGFIVLAFYGSNNSRSLTENGHKGMKELNYSFGKELAVSFDEKTIATNLGTEDLKEFVYTANIDGTSPKLVTSSEGGSNPAFSRDNKKLAFITKRGDPYGDQEQIESVINIVSLADNSLEQNISLKGHNIKEVVFSPDDKGIYFINSQKMINIYSDYKSPADFDIYYLSLLNQKPLNLTKFIKEKDFNPQIKNLQVEKNNVIRFVMGKDLFSESQYEFNEESGELKELYSQKGYIIDSNISKDGSAIAISDFPEEDKLNLVLLSSGEKKWLLDGFIINPRFLNSSKKILFFMENSKPVSAKERLKIRAIDQGKDYQLMMVDFDGTNLKKIDLLRP